MCDIDIVVVDILMPTYSAIITTTTIKKKKMQLISLAGHISCGPRETKIPNSISTPSILSHRSTTIYIMRRLIFSYTFIFYKHEYYQWKHGIIIIIIKKDEDE